MASTTRYPRVRNATAPFACASVIVAPDALDSVSVIVSPPSACESASTCTETVFPVSPAAKVSVPFAAV